MENRGEIKKYISLPMFLIGGGSFFGVIGWMGLAQAAESVIFTVGSSLLSFSGSMTTLFGLMSLERIAPSKNKVRKLKLEIIKHIKLQYPTYIITLENLKQIYSELFVTSREIRDYCNEYRQTIRKLRSELEKLEKHLQETLKDNSALMENDSAEGIAKKLLWSEKQIQLTSYKEELEKLADSFTSKDIEQYRVELSHIKGGLKRLERGIKNYRELMILCNQNNTKYDMIIDENQKVERMDQLLINQEKRLEDLGLEMETKCEEAKVELSEFIQQLNTLIEDDEATFS
ncbi:MAG: hypothetical protein OXD54_07235 [Candidatus Poribacteria bacterium]|nr:hypothetical protein [Candidatus Poribacteria bacterium]